jgi:transposase
VHTADIQDRDGAVDVLKAVRRRFPGCAMFSPTAAMQATNCATPSIAGLGQWTIEIIKRSDKARGFQVLPRRWVVERTFAWLGRCRRLAKDWETTIASSTAWATIASIRMLTRRTARYCYVW